MTTDVVSWDKGAGEIISRLLFFIEHSGIFSGIHPSGKIIEPIDRLPIIKTHPTTQRVLDDLANTSLDGIVTIKTICNIIYIVRMMKDELNANDRAQTILKYFPYILHLSRDLSIKDIPLQFEYVIDGMKNRLLWKYNNFHHALAVILDRAIAQIDRCYTITSSAEATYKYATILCGAIFLYVAGGFANMYRYENPEGAHALDKHYNNFVAV